MNLKTTLLLFVVVALLGGMALYLRDEGGPPELQGSQMLVQDLPGGKVMKFEVLLTSRQDATFERRDDEWWITSPIVDRASPDAVRSLMEALRSNPRLQLDPNVDRETLETLKLEPPLSRVTLWGNEGAPIAIRIGERDPSGAFTNALIEGDPALYRTGANLSNVLSRGRHEWRDTRFFEGDASLLRRIELKRPGEPRVVLERPGTEWLLVEPSPFQANKSVVQPLVNALFLLKIEQFGPLDPQEKELADRGIAEGTQIEVALDWGSRRVVARFGPPAGAVQAGARYAIDSERGHLFVVGGDAMARLTTPTARFRDPKLIRVTPSNVERVRFARPGAPTIDLSFDRTERVFRLTEPFEAAVDDSRESALRGWLLAVSSLEATEFLERSELGTAPGGGDPFAELMVDSLGTLELAVAEKSGAAVPVTIEFADGGDAVFVRRADLAPDTIYVVPRADAAEVLDVDPRQLMVRDLFPKGLLDWKEATARHGDLERRLVRDPTQNAEFWRDPAAPEADTGDFQQVLSELEGTGVLEFLPRDPLASDGLSDDDAVSLSLKIVDEKGRLRELTVRFGAIDSTGTTVLGAAGGDASRFPPRTVFRAEAWMRERLLSLFE